MNNTPKNNSATIRGADYLYAAKKVKDRLAKKNMVFVHEVGPPIGGGLRMLSTFITLVAISPAPPKAEWPRKQLEHEVNILDFLARALKDWPIDESLPDEEIDK